MKKVGSYGGGFLSRIKRSAGDVLAFRWHEDGRERKRILGPVGQFKSEAAAWKEVERLRLGRKGSPETVEQLAQHWKEKESSRRAFSTSETISGYLANWVVPAWGSRSLNEVKAVDVEDWLAKLDLAPGSKKKIPLDGALVAELLAWRQETPYAGDSDYVFASLKMKGKQPYWMSKIMQLYIKPVAAQFGIPLRGWHTFRHSYTTMLRQNGNN